MTSKARGLKNKCPMLWLGVVALVTGLAVVAWVSPLGWLLIGRLNHEHFYRGKPTSYWREQLKEEDGSTLRQLWHDAKSLITLSPRSRRTWEILSGAPENGTLYLTARENKRDASCASPQQPPFVFLRLRRNQGRRT